MIQSLEDAQNWYKSVHELARDMRRLADRHWDRPEWDTVLSRDNDLRELTSDDLKMRAETVLDDLDDLAVLVMFSVFEALVRDQAEAEVDREMDSIRHPAVLGAVKELKDSIRNGSFAKVTRAFKATDVGLTAQVDQAREFRNWVAHGRRGAPRNSVTPKDAFDRLGSYLALLAGTSRPAGIDPEQPASNPPGPGEPPPPGGSTET